MPLWKLQTIGRVRRRRVLSSENCRRYISNVHEPRGATRSVSADEKVLGAPAGTISNFHPPNFHPDLRFSEGLKGEPESRSSVNTQNRPYMIT